MEVTKSDVRRAFNTTWKAELRAATLRLELDYELMTLHDALQANDLPLITTTKERLADIRLELMRLEVL